MEPKPAPTRGTVALAAPVCVGLEVTPRPVLVGDPVLLPVPMVDVASLVLPVPDDGDPVDDDGLPLVVLAPPAEIPEALIAVHLALASAFVWSYGR